jgi:hypothetical protein
MAFWKDMDMDARLDKNIGRALGRYWQEVEHVIEALVLHNQIVVFGSSPMQLEVRVRKVIADEPLKVICIFLNAPPRLWSDGHLIPSLDY